MIKTRVTKNQIKDGYKNIISVSYCELQTLLKYENPRYYTAGIYGWGADIYELDYDTVIVTGYAPFGNIEVKRETIKKYEKAAERMVYDYSKSYEDNKKKLDKLIEKFKNEVLKENEK